MVAPDGPPTLFLFSGTYFTGVLQGNNWVDGDPLYVTASGYVLYKGQVMLGVVFAGNSVKWPPQNNNSTGAVTFKLSSSDGAYWPGGPQDKYNFEGVITLAGGAQEKFRGVLAPQKLGCGLIFNVGSGEALHVPNATAGR